MFYSGISTALVGVYCSSYVSFIRRIQDDTNKLSGLEIGTSNLFLQPRLTTVFDPAFLQDSTRFFTKWQLADRVTVDPKLLPSRLSSEQEETVAETKNAQGKVLGRWIVRWTPSGTGECQPVGKVVRYFNLHDELLQESIHEQA